ncbi:hypothetical protein FRC07_010904 [Ceratobasidium sp. 392]|nr:hypothetical protein FRC07_010904 [Ceratobasidium sp. 392]
MYSYRQALAVFGLSFITISALSLPHSVEGELPDVLPVPLGVNTELAHITQGGATETGDPIVNYPRSHAYDSNYGFSSGDGWETVAVTNLPYKYDNVSSARTNPSLRRQRSGVKRGVGNILGGTVSHTLGATWNSVKGAGKSQDVTITWYTGEDLQNPSCWPESDWAPTDASFACALTLEGWTTKPSCFKFLERSKHVDLTKAAFAELADLDLGILTVQMRMASNPRTWHKDIWGPKV